MKAERFLATVLFTDIVGSTEHAVKLSDRGWRALLERHLALIRRELERHGGHELNSTGDGVLATFDRPERAIRCACAIRDAVRALGIEIRSGLHMGEVEKVGRTIGGVAVHIGARVAAQAGPGEVLVSGTIRDAEVGSGFGFEDRGVHLLKGVPGEWRLFAIASVPELAAESRPRGWRSPLATSRVAAAAAALSLLLLGAAGWLFFGRERTQELPAASEVAGGTSAAGGSGAVPAPSAGAGTPYQIVPFTESPGLEALPSWAPDSKRLAHAAERSGDRDVWIKPVGGGAGVVVAGGAFEDTQPAWSPDGREILFVSSRGYGSKLDQNEVFGHSLGGAIWSVPAAGGAPVRIIGGGFNPTWSPDGSRIAFDSSLDGPRRIWVARADGSEAARVSTDHTEAAAHTRPDWSPDGAWIVYQRQESGRSDIQMVRAEGGSPRWITNDAPADLGPAWTPDGSGIVFSSDRGGRLNLWRLHLNADRAEGVGVPEQLTAGAGDDIDPAVSPDGSELAYSNVRMVENLWRMPLDRRSLEPSGPPQAVLASSRNDNQPAISPDGRKLAFTSDRGGTTDLWLAGAAGEEPRRLTQDEAKDQQPDWSPDGRRLAFFSDRAGNNDIWMIPVAGGESVQLTDDPADDINPYWSPDGKRIAFMSDRSGRSEVWVVNVDGSGLRRLTDIGATGHEARWSPDGRWIAFTSISGGERNVWVVPAGGGSPRRLTPESTQDAHALWSADGRGVLYLTDHRSLRAVPLAGGAPRTLYEAEAGQRIDDTHISRDGSWLYLTLLHPEGDLWIVKNFR